MNGKKKVIEGIIPVTTTKAVYIDGTNKTLQEAIDNGDLGGTVVTTASNFITDAFMLTNDIQFEINPTTKAITLRLLSNLTLRRIMGVCWANGNYNAISVEDNTVIPMNHGLYWNNSKQFFTLPYDGNGIKVPVDTVLVGLNWYGRITAGILAPVWDKYHPFIFPVRFDTERYISMEERSNAFRSSFHSMVVVNDELWTLECFEEGNFSGKCEVYSLPTLSHKSTFYQHIAPTKVGGQINLRLVCADYNQNSQCLLLGSGTADGSDEGNMEGYIFYNVQNWKTFTDIGNPITLDNSPHTILNFHKDNLFDSKASTAKIIWGELPDTIYLTFNNLQFCYKLLLGTGTNRFEYGDYNYIEGQRYNGTFKVIQVFSQEYPPVGNKDIQFHNGYLYYPVKYTKGGYRVYKTCLRHDGTMYHEMLIYDPLTATGTHRLQGSPEGIVVYDGKIYCGHASTKDVYIFDANI